MMKRQFLLLSMMLALGACTVGDGGNGGNGGNTEGSHAVRYYDDPANPYGHIIARFDRAAGVFVSEDFAEQLGAQTVNFALTNGSTVRIESSASARVTEEVVDVPLGALLSAEASAGTPERTAGHVIVSPTDDVLGFEQSGGCNKVYVYINGGYAYSFCGHYFCHKKTCHSINGFHHVNLWNGGGFLTIY